MSCKQIFNNKILLQMGDQSKIYNFLQTTKFNNLSFMLYDVYFHMGFSENYIPTFNEFINKFIMFNIDDLYDLVESDLIAYAERSLRSYF